MVVIREKIWSEFLLPTAFAEFFRKLEALEFQRMNPSEIFNRIKASPWLAFTYKKRDGYTEVCYSFHSKGKTVIVCSSYIEELGKPRVHDYGWVIIVDDLTPEKPCFYSFGLRRTKNFLRQMYRWAEAFKERVVTWPAPCQICGHGLIIKPAGTDMHAVTFACPNGHKLTVAGIYQGMSERTVRFISGYFRRFKMYRDQDYEKTGKIRQFVRKMRFDQRHKDANPPSQNVGRTIVTGAFNDFPHGDKDYPDE